MVEFVIGDQSRKPQASQAAPRRTTRFDAADAAWILASLAVAVAMRLPDINPPSLWLDDAWQALAIWASDLDQTLLIGGLNPGFALILSLLPQASDPETTAQFPALVAGLAIGPLLYLGATRLDLARMSRVFLAIIPAISPMIVINSTRVKPYTLDAALSALFFVMVLRSLRQEPDRSSLAPLYSISAIAITISSYSALVYGPVLAYLTATSRRDRFRRSVILGCSAVLAIGYYALWIRPRLPPLQRYWQPYFLDSSSAGELLLSGAGALERLSSELLPIRGLSEAVGGAGAFLSTVDGTLMAVLLVASLTFIRRTRPGEAAVLALPFGVTLVAFAAGLIPLGTGRTDAFVFPPILLAVAIAGSDRLAKLEPRWKRASLASAFIVLPLISAVIVEQSSYPTDMVGAFSENLRSATLAGWLPPVEGTLLVLNSPSQYALAYYSHMPWDLEPARELGNGFRVRFGERVFVVDPSRALADCPTSGLPGPDSVVLVWSHPRHEGLRPFAECAAAGGLVEVGSFGDERAGSAVVRFERQFSESSNLDGLIARP